MERRRRLDQRLRRALAALPPVRLPQGHRARPRARLADQPTRTSPPTTSGPTALIGVSGLAGDPAMPPQDDYPTPPLPLQAPSRRLAQAFDRLGWHWWPVPAGVISRDYDGRLGLPRLRHLQRLPARLDEQVLDSRSGRRRWTPASSCAPTPACCGSRRAATGAPTGAVYVDRNTGRRALPDGRGRHPGRQRRRHAAPAARLRQPRQQLGPGRPQPAAPHAGRLRDVGRRAARLPHGLRRRR